MTLTFFSFIEKTCMAVAVPSNALIGALLIGNPVAGVAIGLLICTTTLVAQRVFEKFSSSLLAGTTIGYLTSLYVLTYFTSTSMAAFLAVGLTAACLSPMIITLGIIGFLAQKFLCTINVFSLIIKSKSK